MKAQQPVQVTLQLFQSSLTLQVETHSNLHRFKEIVHNNDRKKCLLCSVNNI